MGALYCSLLWLVSPFMVAYLFILATAEDSTLAVQEQCML